LGWQSHPVHNFERGGTMVKKHKKNKLKDADNMDKNRSSEAGSDNLSKPSDINQIFSMLSRMDLKSSRDNLILKENDYRIDILNSLKTFLPDEKCKIIDSIVFVLSSSPEQNIKMDITEDTKETAKVDTITEDKNEAADLNSSEST
jgi:hypothetical protein